METTEALFLLRQLGLAFEVNGGKLDVSPAELLDDDVVWLIRRYRDGIVAELLDDSRAWAWAVHFPDAAARSSAVAKVQSCTLPPYADRAPIEVYSHPDATRAEILERYPNATAADRLPVSMWPADRATEGDRQ